MAEKQQVVLITGAARGIGRHIARTFALKGDSLALADIGSTDLVVSEMGELGVDVLPLNVDVRREDSVKEMVDATIARYGRIDTLVNNAGIVTHFSWAPRWSRVADMDLAFWSNVMDTNLGGTFLCTKHVLPHMERQGSGHIISLYGGTDPAQMGDGASPYGVSKEAIRKFTGFVAEEERGRNICVVAISPGGAIATEEAPEDVRQRLPGPDHVGNGFVMASRLGMEDTGKLLQLEGDRLIELAQAVIRA
jgi:3-oxoacyl-[acyl-carrier protein] reductase